MNDSSYQCHYCKKQFPMYDKKYGGKIPQSEYLAQTRRIFMRGTLIGNLYKICYKCEDKFSRCVTKILAKHRKRGPVIGAWQMKKWREKAEEETGPMWPDFTEEQKQEYIQRQNQLIEEWTERKFSEEYGIIECTLCGARFNEFKGNLHKCNTIVAGMANLGTIERYCNQCHEEIINEIKALL